jgi:UDP-N-acetyl-2-amino-2-deoxyglucuronate dehydrogenase
LQEIERETGHHIYTILQLRLHDSIIALKKKVDAAPKDKIYEFDLTYQTSRGNWYYSSWKGDVAKSGGIATNIGVHFFDMLGWVFGDIKENIVHIHTHDRAAGYLVFDRAKVRWFLSIDYDTIPEDVRKTGKRTFRSLEVDGDQIEFSDGFTELHTNSYKDILAGGGFRIDASKQAIEIVHDIRTKTPIGLKGDYHPFANLPLKNHPFKL